MPKLPQAAVDPIAEAVYDWYAREHPQRHRAHLGGSQVGQECDAFLWLQFRWADTPEPGGRVVSLWQRGWREEAEFEALLEGIGVEVTSLDPETGKQFRESRFAGHFGHGADGKLGKVPRGGEAIHLAEYKTSNDKLWQKLHAEGVQKAQSKNYDQCQVGMLVHGLERCLFCSVNKNTDERHFERLRLDRPHAERLLARAGRIIFSPTRPPRISDDPAFYKCSRFCDLKEVCHYGKVAEVNCRTCAHSTPTEEGDGAWSCALVPGYPLPEDVQRRGCDAHVFLPDFVPLAVVDAVTDEAGSTVEYEGGLKNGPGGLASPEFRDRLNGDDPERFHI